MNFKQATVNRDAHQHLLRAAGVLSRGGFCTPGARGVEIGGLPLLYHETGERFLIHLLAEIRRLSNQTLTAPSFVRRVQRIVDMMRVFAGAETVLADWLLAGSRSGQANTADAGGQFSELMVRSIELYARVVIPRVRELLADESVATAAA